MRGSLIHSAKRTPIGRYLGGLASLGAVELGARAAAAAVGAAGIDPARIDEAIIGNVIAAGLGQSPARQVAIRAGIPASASALTINMVCGSGLRAVMLADALIRAGEARAILAGGIESMSNAPHLVRGGRLGWKFGDQTLVDAMQNDGLTCPFEHWPMGKAAEYTARKARIDRAAVDAFALESHRRAVHTRDAGGFAAEIEPIERVTKGKTERIVHDENPRAEASAESLAGLAPAFEAEGIVTAGNSSSLADGAAMLVIGSADSDFKSAPPLARIRACATSGGEPRDLFFAPIRAIGAAVAEAGLRMSEIDLFEINEAFAAQMLACMNALELAPDRVNVNGGAIALGHPIGASGARILVTLLHAMKSRGARLGVAAACLGGGNAVAVVVEREPHFR